MAELFGNAVKLLSLPPELRVPLMVAAVVQVLPLEEYWTVAPVSPESSPRSW